MIRTDRTAIITAQRCPRERYYQRHFGGSGIERKRKGLPLVFGSAFHAGAEKLLKGDVEGAVGAAILHLELAFSVDGIDVEEKETAYLIGEQRAIAEGLLRGWWAAKGEQFLRDFEVLAIEQEGEAELAEGLVLQFRPDALVRERESGDLYVVSWKTASTYGQYTVNQIQTDMQSMSEVWGVHEASVQRVMYGDEVACEVRNRVEGVLYLFAVKGQRKLDDYLGFKVQNTPLAYCWKRAGVTPDEDEYAWTYGWATEETNPKTMKLVQTKLGKGFRKVPVAENYPGGVKGWIEDLAAQRVAPRHINALEGIFPQSLPVSRRADEIESWRHQTVCQETRVENAVAYVEDCGDVDAVFPQHTHSCFRFNSKCEMFDVCWTPAVKADPLGSGLYQIRVANHPEKEDEE